tara:strand:- start:249 stop:563 length:315 start_codon:yes stop_codon:yes gene_type:complete
MKILLSTGLFIFFSIGLCFGQTNQSISTSNSLESKKTNVSSESSSDDYMGYEDQILKRLVVKKIPQDFPKPLLGQTREEYKETMFTWFRENLDMVEKKYQSNLK